MPTVEAAPAALRPLWAGAITTVLQRWKEARDALDQDAVDQALKWKMVLPSLLLRKRGRGGRRGKQRAIGQRLRLLQSLDLKTLVDEWEADTVAERARVARSRGRAESKLTPAQQVDGSMQRGVKLIKSGKLRRC